jgi:GTPase Era involved in 16S rRNA processing
VLGYVQSGKTANFTAVISKAADVGFRFIIVLSGLTNSLREQTQERMYHDLIQRSPERWFSWTDFKSDIGDTPMTLLDIHANVFVERASQKGIVIGHRGSRLREVGTAARKQIEAMLGTPVYLDLHVKIAKDWQRDPKQLRRLGF